MSEYPNELSAPTITQWGDYTIEVRTSNHTWGHLIGQYSAKYDVFKDGKLLAHGSVAGHHGTAGLAAENALRVAKIDARESLDGPFPEDEIDESSSGAMQASRDATGVNYGGYVIVHQPEGNHRRRTDSYAILRHRDNGGLITHHAELATDAKYSSEEEAKAAAVTRAIDWIDANESKSE